MESKVKLRTADDFVKSFKENTIQRTFEDLLTYMNEEFSKNNKLVWYIYSGVDKTKEFYKQMKIVTPLLEDNGFTVTYQSDMRDGNYYTISIPNSIS